MFYLYDIEYFILLKKKKKKKKERKDRKQKNIYKEKTQFIW